MRKSRRRCSIGSSNAAAPEPAPFRAEVAEQAENWSWNGHRIPECSADGLIDPRTVTVWLDEHLPTDRTVAIDSGLFMGFPSRLLECPGPPRIPIRPRGSCRSAWGSHLGIGGAIARPERLTIVAVGDGGALMSLPEFETAARLRLPMIILIYNDCAYGAEVFDFPSHNHDGLVRFQSTDFADIGRALGMHGVHANWRTGT